MILTHHLHSCCQCSFASESKVYVDGKLVHGDAIRLDRDLVNVKDNMCSLQKALEYTKVGIDDSWNFQWQSNLTFKSNMTEFAKEAP